MRTINRRSALVAGALGAIAARVSPDSPRPGSVDDVRALPLTAAIPRAWREWRNWGSRTLTDLLAIMAAEAHSATVWPALHAATITAERRFQQSGTWDDWVEMSRAEGHLLNSAQGQAVLIGWCLALTADHARRGPDAWLAAAMAAAGLTPLTAEEATAGYELINREGDKLSNLFDAVWLRRCAGQKWDRAKEGFAWFHVQVFQPASWWVYSRPRGREDDPD